MRTITLALVIGTALAMLGSSLGLPPARAQREETVPVVSQPAGPVSRPDLALSLRDLPPGYEEAPSLDLALNDTPLHDRVIRRTRSGAGQEWIWTMTYQAEPREPGPLDLPHRRLGGVPDAGDERRSEPQ